MPLGLREVLFPLPQLVCRLRQTEDPDRRTQRERFRRKPFTPWQRGPNASC